MCKIIYKFSSKSTIFKLFLQYFSNERFIFYKLFMYLRFKDDLKTIKCKKLINLGKR